MRKSFANYGRITSFIFIAGFFASRASAEPRGHWVLADDGTGIEVRACDTSVTSLCGVITRLPKSAAALPTEDRKTLCGSVLIGDLRPAKAGEDELARLEGWVDNMESTSAPGKALRYPASFVVLSAARARLEIRGTFGIVIDRFPMLRPLTPVNNCK